MPERAMVLALIYASLALLLLGRLFQLQIIQGDEWAASVEDSRDQIELLPAKRGRILDRTGTPIVDSRAIYQASVVMSDLELPWRIRRSLPFFELGEAAFDRLLAELAIRLNREHEDLREVVLRELAACPTVAFRRGFELRETALTLLAIPAAALAPRDDGTGATAELANADLVFADPRDALIEEVRTRWNDGAWVGTEAEFNAVAAEIVGEPDGIDASRSRAVLAAFASTISMPLGEQADAAVVSWRLLTDERRAEAVTALARFLREDADAVGERLDRSLRSARKTGLPLGAYFAASAHALEIAALLPTDGAFYPLPLRGVPPARERVLLIQGDREGVSDDAGSRVCARIAAALGNPGDWVLGLVERHARRVSIRTAERESHHKLLALDVDLADRLTTGLAKRLAQAGLAGSSVDLEQHLAEARRIADREWAGQGHHDPLPLVDEIPHSLALTLDGAGSSAPRDIRLEFDEAGPELPGLRVTVVGGREYPHGDSLCHLIGSLGRVDGDYDRDEALERGLDPEGSIGRTGLEKHYDDLLRGTVGRKVWRHTMDGVELLFEKPTEPGRDLVTEIDLQVQLAAEKALDTWFDLAGQLDVATDIMDQARSIGKGRAGMVVIDVHTGGILALASAPRYRPDELGKRWKELLADPAEPLHDHSAEAGQPPGSALKILTALAALELGKMTPGEVIHSKGYMAMVAGKKVLRSHAPAGDYDLVTAIQVSDNCYFATIGARVGGSALSDYFRRFGIGTSNALDVPQQRPGILPHPDTLGRRWITGDTWRLAIGQFSSNSPLQVATIAAAVANGGHVVRPYVVRPSGAPEVIDLHIRAQHLEEVRRGMEAVTAPGGTARYLQLGGDSLDIEVAAKTGTSEWGNTSDQTNFPDHAWLIGYAPAREPRIAFAIFIHGGTSGGRACSGVAKFVLEAYFGKYGPKGHNPALGL